MSTREFPAAVPPALSAPAALALLEWQIAMGADEAISEIARNWLTPTPQAEPVQALADPSPLGLPLTPPSLAGEGRVGALAP